jgi:hypothetical protein
MFSTKWKWTLLLLPVVTLLILTGCEQKFVKDWGSQPQDMTAAMGAVPDSLQKMNLAPLVKGYHNGGDLYFIHTEASDSSVAQMLTEMMEARVVYLPGLAQTSEALLADIYVFKNGVEGHGPFGFQPDVFGSVPGDQGYSPLRSIHLVQWNEDADPQELLTVQAIKQAEEEGRLTIQKPGIVVNMPVLVWPGGHR